MKKLLKLAVPVVLTVGMSGALGVSAASAHAKTAHHHTTHHSKKK